MENFDEIYQKFIDRRCTRQEAEQLLEYFLTEKGDQDMADKISRTLEVDPPPPSASDLAAIKRNEEYIMRKISPAQPMWRPAYTIVAIAASIVLVVSALLMLSKQEMPAPTVKTAIDAEPGSNRATLTLAGGKRINLDDAESGNLAEQAGVQITKAADGQLIYNVSGANQNTSVQNTVTTPNGGQYEVQLPDGSKVILNAASSLTYPVSFAKQKQRIVELSGEAYFEVAHNKAQPFLVKTASQTVEVLGTHFNINSYPDEKNIATTLAEGSVKVSSKGNSKLLKPGEQSLNTDGSISIRQADMETALAWKNGNIIFKSAGIEEIMKQVKRWYNIEAVYEGQIPQRTFSGGISRSSKLSVLLNILKDSGVNYEFKETSKGKTLIIKP